MHKPHAVFNTLQLSFICQQLRIGSGNMDPALTALHGSYIDMKGIFMIKLAHCMGMLPAVRGP